MKQITVFGAGKSSGYLITYLAELAAYEAVSIAVADKFIQHIGYESEYIRFVQADINNDGDVDPLIREADVIISLLPPSFHEKIALKCLSFHAHFITASYNNERIKKLADKAKSQGLSFIMEAGFDPGLDHMSIMEVIEAIHEAGGRIRTLKSYAGGLPAPGYDTNPWQYKFTWNPANVVLAGQDKPAKFLDNGRIKLIPYHRLFERTESLNIFNLGDFEAYINRNALPYLELYKLPDIDTLYRGTLRKPGFCRAWNMLVQLGLTNNEEIIDDAGEATYEDIMRALLPDTGDKTLMYSLVDYIDMAMGDPAIQAFKWLELLSHDKPELKNATPAGILQKRLEEKWAMEENDKDWVIQHHVFEFIRNGQYHRKTATLSLQGENKTQTAMAKLVGLPLGIIARNILQGNISLPGVHIPTEKAIYEPVLDELAEHDIMFEYGN